MKSGRRNVMFIHQTLPDAASDSSGGGGSTKKRGRPKKMKLMDHPHQAIVTTPATSSSVIKETATVTNNSSSGVEEVCTSPSPLQIDLSPSVINDNEQNNNATMIASEPVPEDSDSKTVVDHTTLDNGQPPVPSLPPPTTIKKQRIRRSSSTGKSSFGEQTKGIQAGEKIVVSFKMSHVCNTRYACMYVCTYDWTFNIHSQSCSVATE